MTLGVPEPSPGEAIELLRDRLRKLERDRRPAAGYISSGSQGLDHILPQPGFRRGSLVEWLGETGSGRGMLAFAAAREACRQGGVLVVVDFPYRFYPPAAAHLGIDLRRLIVVRPASEADCHWALCQALSCRGVAAALCWSSALGSRILRRLQLAAETGGSLGLLVRPAKMLGKPTWSDVQLFVQPRPTPPQTARRHLRVEVCRSREGAAGGHVELEVSELGQIHEASTLPLAAGLANPTIARRSASA